ncbi:unnamed protein product [Sphacelaria rigidula]
MEGLCSTVWRLAVISLARSNANTAGVVPLMKNLAMKAIANDVSSRHFGGETAAFRSSFQGSSGSRDPFTVAQKAAHTRPVYRPAWTRTRLHWKGQPAV